MPEEKLPPIPRFQWDTFNKLLREARAALRPFTGKVLAGESLQQLQLGVRNVLPSGTSASVVQLSLNHLVGATLSARELNQLAYRFVAQREQLGNGTPLRIEATDLRNFWVAAHVVDAHDSRWQGAYGTSIRFRVVSSLIAPVEINQWWSARKARYMAYYRDIKGNGFGFTSLRVSRTGVTQRGLPLVNSAQFFGLRCFLYLSGFQQEKWKIMTVGHTGTTMQYNQALLRARDRSITACVRDAESVLDCWRCPVGLDVCANATHSISNVAGACYRCGRVDSTLSSEQTICRVCTEGA